MASKVPMAPKVPIAIKVPMAKKVSMATKFQWQPKVQIEQKVTNWFLAVLASYVIWACFDKIKLILDTLGLGKKPSWYYYYY